MLTKHCLQEFILDCQLRRLSPRTVKGYHNNTHNFLIYSEKHYEITEVEEIRTVHIKQYIQYLLNKKLSASYINGILKCLRAFFHFAVQEEYIYANPTDKVRMQKPVCLFGLFSITFAVVTAMVNVGGLFRDGLLTQFFYVSFDSLTSVTVLCVITAMTAYQARLLSRKRNRQQNMVNA